MVKKKFGISSAVNQALTQTIQMADAENSNFYNTEILIDRITLDTANPRKQKITIKDIKNGFSNDDPDYDKKMEEYDGLLVLSDSIKREGLLNPISVIEDAGNFKVVAGERRYLATVLAKKSIIEARVFKNKPKPLDLKIIQWAENQARKDLSLFDKLMNIVSIIEHYENEHGETLTAIRLSEILGVSRQQAQYLKSIIVHPTLMHFIETGKVNTFELARKFAAMTVEEVNDEVLGVKTVVIDKKGTPNREKLLKAGRKREAINLGKTSKPLVAKTIVESVLAMKKFKSHEQYFMAVDWQCLNQSTKAFQKLVEIMEKEIGALV